MPMLKRLVVIIMFLLNINGVSYAMEMGAGISFSNKYLTVLSQDDTELASFEGDSGLWPYLTIKSHDKYFSDESSFGYFYYGWYSQSAVSKVKNQPDRVLPAPVNLQFLYAGATIFYVLGEKNVNGANNNSQHAVGIGAGWGASRISGDIPAAFIKTGVDEHIDTRLTGNSANIFYRYIWGDMFVMFDFSTVQVRNGDKKYDTADSTITWGKYFDF